MDFGLPIGINAHTRKAGIRALQSGLWHQSGLLIGILLLIGSKIHPVERFRSRSARPDGPKCPSVTPATPLVRICPERQWAPHGHRGKTNPEGRQVTRIGCSSNVFVIRAVGHSRTIAHNEAKVQRLLSTLIEAFASERRGLAISNEEQSDV
jgi:hypothetical protein